MGGGQPPNTSVATVAGANAAAEITAASISVNFVGRCDSIHIFDTCVEAMSSR